MKILAVVAVLLVAAYAFSLPKLPKSFFPKMSKRGKTTIEPPKMPCAFKIDVSSRVDYSFIENGSHIFTFEDTSTAYFDGTLTTKYSFHFARLEYDTVIYRTDQSYKDEKTGKTFYTKYTAMYDPAQGVNQTCEAVGITPEDMQTELEADFAGFLEKHTCDSVKDGKYNGKDVKVCLTTESGNPQNLYVDKDGYFVGSSITIQAGDYNVASTFNFTYTFKEPDLKAFTVDKKIVSVCDEKAYEAPKSQCNSLASTTKAALLVVLAAVAATLF